MSPVVSVVTPFYNTADYLDQCITSVRRQSFADWEYVLLDNCSTDGSADIARRHAGEDARIRLHSNRSHLSQLENYNEALTLISPAAAYCKFVQADDLIFPNCLQEMSALAAANPRAGLVSAYGLFGNRVYLSGLELQEQLLTGGDIVSRFLRDGLYLFGTQTSVLMRADLVRARRPFFDITSPFADVEACLQLLKTSDFGFVHQVLTYTRRDNESIYSGVRTYEPMLLCRAAALRRHGADFLDAATLSQLLADAERNLYDFLGECWWLRHGEQALWDFYRRGLGHAGTELSMARVRWHALKALGRRALNPLDTISRLQQRRARS
jgi:glycosyltransferase involved in cell wall biosynthesis